MIEDKISLAIKDIQKLKEELKEIRKDLKEEEKIETEEYEQKKKVLKDLKQEVKDYEEEWERELLQDESYNKLRELKVQKEEEIAIANQKLFEAIEKLPPKLFMMNMDTEEGVIKIQIQPEMRVYLNGKEEKKRVI